MWFLTGFWLFLNDGGWRALITLRAGAFVLIGIVVNWIVGHVVLWLADLAGKALSRLLPPPPWGEASMMVIGFVTLTLVIMQLAAGALLALATYNHMPWRWVGP